MIYLDHAATTPVPRAVADAMYAVLTEQFANPSAQYPMGLEMKKQLAAWRRTIAGAMGCDPKALFFTSCGTEGDNWAVRAALWQNRHLGRHIVTTAVEHSAVLEACRWAQQDGCEVTYLTPDAQGNLSAQAVLDAVRPDTALVSIMMVNNELGNVFPIAEIARGLAAKNPKTLLHTDAVQGFLEVPFAARTLGADFVSVSAHKIGGPKGIGALYAKKGLRLPPLMFGGGQEKGMRPGTEPLPNIAAFAKACAIRMAHFDEDFAHVAELAAYLKEQAAANLPDAAFNGEGDVPHVVNLSIPGCKSEVMLRVLEGDEVYVSSGSACSKGKQSGVLKALGLPKARTDSAIRVSFAPFNTKEDVDAFIAAAQKGVKMLRR